MSSQAGVEEKSAGAEEAGKSARLYRMLWRWHFYAGLFCIPFVIVLAITGSVYLFRPQIENWIDRDLMVLERTGQAATQDEIVAAATGSVPGSRLASIILPERPDQAARVLVSEGGVRTRVYVHPDTLEVLKSVAEEDRFRRIVFKMHGELLLGPKGSYLVELAASWAIVMVVTGLYLWWPRGARGLGGVLYPRIGQGSKRFWRDIHAVAGVWVSAFALFLLASGMPWATVWGSAFKQVREWTGTAPVSADWFTSSADEHAHHAAQDHDHAAMGHDDLPVDAIVARAHALDLAPPVIITPPTQSSPYWQVKSDTANRPEGADVFLSPQTGEAMARRNFGDRHVIDQIVGVGIAAHEGQLFGPLNQILGLLTAMGLVLLCVSAFVMWRQRAPGAARAGALAAPAGTGGARVGYGLAAIIIGLGVVLPVLGISLVVIAVIERLVLARWSAARMWLGLPERHSV